jgi:hypothetical protein
MDKTKHTPGPWRVEFPEHPNAMTDIFAPSPSTWATATDDEPWRVAYVLRDSNKHQQPIDDANAHLIAAAPELLDRVRDAVLVLEAIRENWGDDHPGLLRTIDEELPPLRAAIAKAEGR